jgi:hypothetical protein
MYAKTERAVTERELRIMLDVAAICDLEPLPGSVSRFAPVEPHVVANAFDLWGQVQSAFIVSLLPMQQIPLHVDASIAPAVRYHIPIRTNPDCWSFHAGEWHHLEVGGLYRMDPIDPHGAVNWGAEPRWHLLVDVLESTTSAEAYHA